MTEAPAAVATEAPPRGSARGTGQLRRAGRHAPAALLALAALPTLVRLVGDHSRAWLIMIVAFVPVAVFALLALTVLAGALRRWWTLAAGVALLVVNALWLAPLYAGDDPPRGERMVAMAVNLQYGWTDAAEVVAAVREREVAVLGVTELTPDAVADLAAAGLDDLLPHRVLRPDVRAHGSGLWSRYPLEAAPPWDGTHRMPGAVADLAGREVVLRVVHPMRTGRYSAAAYRADYAILARRMAALDPQVPALVLGDFNATRDHDAFRDLLGERWRDASEYAGSGLIPTWSPRYWIPPLIQLDHILTSRHFGAEWAQTFDLTGSDHEALVAELRLAAER